MKKNKPIIELDESTFPFIIYPKEYVLTILFTIVVSLISIWITYLLITDIQVLSFDYFMIVIFTLILILISIYFITISYFLITRRIFIEVSKEEIKLRCLTKTEVVSIKDITMIYRQMGGKQGRAFIFKCKNTQCFKIPNNWFSEKELMELFNLLMKLNNKINLDVSNF
ncbi:hypothetical protein [Clostridium sp. HMP27]|uniref:hypothetical protein n=1 Tax=Clostridium sp. HMP27 TaxID=1487921 RepID=UPI00052E4893|nr:hypothetical protein [Clostridium sp. HMP27]KGK81153.1 hypothetical protein DP68_18570 [Clostridium sp. HMP27]